MSQLSIRGKMVAVIALLLVAMALLGALAVHGMRAINAHTEQIANSWLPSVRLLGELRSDEPSMKNTSPRAPDA